MPNPSALTLRNPLVQLPRGDYIGVRVYCPHPCGGIYLVEAWVYGAAGRIGRWMDA